jgi:hypothetical protein
MKHFFTLITILAFGLGNAQVFSENFDNGVPGNFIEDTVNGNLSWQECGSDTGGVVCPINGDGSATFYHASYTAYNTALMTPVMDLSSGTYKVTYTLAKRDKDDRINQFYVEISTDGGENWTVMKEQLEEVYDPTQYSIILTPYSPTAETSVRFRARNQGGYRLIMDDVSITEVTSDDPAIESLDMPSLIVAGDVAVKGTIRNLGINALTSFDLNWQADGGEIHTQAYNGQNIGSGQEFNFTHADLWSVAGGDHSISVWISNSNVTDGDDTNNEVTKDVMVASGVAYKVPMMEKFTSSTCYPCFLFNTGSFNPFYEDYGHDKAVLINYQVNWPGAGDPYYTAEVGSRVNYYGINAAPTLLMNTTDVGQPSTTGLQNLLDDIIENDHLSYFKIDADHAIDGNNIDVTVDITPYISGNYTLRVMVIEKETTGNIATNGETHFEHVFMKALPNPNGTAVSLVQDETQHFDFSYDMSSTNVEEMDDLAVVVFLQDDSTKQIMQSGYTDSSGLVLGTSEAATGSHIVLVPNPTSGIVKIISENDVNVQIFDLSGKNVFNQANVINNSTLNLSALGKGIFIVTMTDKDGNQTVKKLVIK